MPETARERLEAHLSAELNGKPPEVRTAAIERLLHNAADAGLSEDDLLIMLLVGGMSMHDATEEIFDRLQRARTAASHSAA